MAHRNLTGRQLPVAMTDKLRSVYSQILVEKLPDRFLNLLSQLESKAMDKE